MATIRSIEKEKKDIIKNFKPEEMTAYLENLVAVYYESFLEQDLEKHLAVNKLIEEAVEIYESVGYNNTSKNELIFKLNKANELLGKSLEEKHNLNIDLSKVIVENYYSELILEVLHANNVLESLIDSYEKAPSEELASAIKKVAAIEDNRLLRRNYLTEEKNSSYFSEEIEILKENYSTFENLQKKINSF